MAFLPQGAQPAHLDPEWGLYDADGRLIELAAWRRESPAYLIGQSRQLSLDAFTFDEAPDEAYVYGGVAVSHYGHFVCTTLARLWYLRHASKHIKIAFHSHGDVHHILSFPFIRDIFAAIDITEDNFVVFSRPTRIRRVIVPGAAMEEQSFVYDEFRRFGHRVGEAMTASDDQTPADHPVFQAPEGWLLKGCHWLGFDCPPRRGQPAYVSKIGLAGGQHIWQGEGIIEDRMRREGCLIVRPETLTVSDQISLFRGGRTVVGTSSSAFHSTIFTPPSGRIVALNHLRSLNSNFVLIDKVNGNRASYYYPTSGFRDDVTRSGFNNVICAHDSIADIADSLCRLAFGHSA